MLRQSYLPIHKHVKFQEQEKAPTMPEFDC